MNTYTPASTSFSLFSIGQTDPLGCHCANVVVGVKVGLFNFASIYHIDHIIYGDAVKGKHNHSMKKSQSIYI